MSWGVCEDWMKRVNAEIDNRIAGLKEEQEEYTAKYYKDKIQNLINDMLVLKDVLADNKDKLLSDCWDFHQRKLKPR